MGLLVVVGLLVCLIIAAAILYRRLSAPTSLPVTAAWIDELSVGRYEPMKRLLAPEELEFVRAHPRCTPGKAAEFRRERCRLFESYLHCLHADFQRVSMALKIIMVQSRYDRPDLAALLIRTERAFVLGLMMVYVRVLLYRLGIGTVEVGGLLKVFETARLELRSLVPVQAGIAA